MRIPASAGSWFAAVRAPGRSSSRCVEFQHGALVLGRRRLQRIDHRALRERREQLPVGSCDQLCEARPVARALERADHVQVVGEEDRAAAGCRVDYVRARMRFGWRGGVPAPRRSRVASLQGTRRSASASRPARARLRRAGRIPAGFGRPVLPAAGRSAGARCAPAPRRSR